MLSEGIQSNHAKPPPARFCSESGRNVSTFETILPYIRAHLPATVFSSRFVYSIDIAVGGPWWRYGQAETRNPMEIDFFEYELVIGPSRDRPTYQCKVREVPLR